MSEGDKHHVLERETELAIIEGLVESLRGGIGGVLVFEGPAGIGKTALLRSALSLARRCGVEIVSARGSELERDFAYGVARQLLEPRLTKARDRDGLFAGAAALAAPLFEPEPARRGDRAAGAGGGTDGRDSTFALLHGLYWLCANLAESKQLLLCIDDLHWADQPSLRFLAYLIHRLEGLSIAIILATRPEGDHADPGLIGEIERRTETRIVRPRALSQAGVGQLVEERLSEPVDAAFAAACHTATGGNPFLVQELASGLREEHVAPTEADVKRVQGLVPGGIKRSILLRLGRLGPDALELARAVAVLGEDAELRRVSQLNERRVAEAADGLIRAEILENARPLAFVHPIARTAVYDDLTPAERARRHGEAARPLASEGAALERIAAHLLASEPGNEAWVVDVLRDAAGRAIEKGAPEIAIGYLQRALAEAPPKPRRSRLLLELGVAEFRAGDATAVSHLEAALDSAEDEETRITSALALGLALSIAEQMEDAINVFERALSELGKSDHDLALTLEGALLAIGLLDVSTAPVVAERIEQLRRTVDDGGGAPRSVLAALSVRVAMANEPSSSVVELAERAFTPEAKVDEVAADAPYFYAACGALVMAERFDLARPLLDRSLAEARALGLAPQLSAALCFRSWLASRCGEIAEADADARLSIEACRLHSQPLVLPLAIAVLIGALAERGRFSEAEQELERSALLREEGSSVYFALLLHGRARLRLAEGRFQEALEDALACGDRLQRLLAPSPSLGAWRSDAALAKRGLGELDDARRLAADELKLARAFGASGSLGIALRAAGLVHDGAKGLELLHEAVAVLERSCARLEYARALTDFGAALRRARRRSEARNYLRPALDLGHRCGALALVERAHHELRATGARPRRVVLTGSDALTASERRVAEMAAEGLTNREIAQALFVTARTVEGHLTHVFQKLDIKSRTELRSVLSDSQKEERRRLPAGVDQKE
jgi:DNA-binding CsgD family transcriptional regulator